MSRSPEYFTIHAREDGDTCSKIKSKVLVEATHDIAFQFFLVEGRKTTEEERATIVSIFGNRSIACRKVGQSAVVAFAGYPREE